jgi:O-antigen/teichoic acid export membrane protein
MNYPSAQRTRRNIFLIWINRILLALSGFIITPLLANELGLAVMGVWMLVTQIVAQLTLLDAGVGSSLTRLLAGRFDSLSEVRPQNIVSTAFWVLGGVGVILIFSAPLIADHFIAAVSIPGGVMAESWWLMFMAVIFTGVSLPLRCGYGLLASRHRFDKIQSYENVSIFIRLSAIAIFVYFGWLSLLRWGSLVFLSFFISSLLIYLQGLRFFYGIKTLRFSNISRAAFALILPLSATAVVVTLSNVLLFQGSPILIGLELGTRAVTLLSIPLFLYLSITPFFQAFATIISPVAAGISSEEELAKLVNFYKTCNSYLCSAALASFLFVYTVGDKLLEKWLLGPSVTLNDVREMWVALSILLLGYAVSITAPMARSILSAVGSHWPAAMADLSTSILGLAACFVSINYFSLGTSGAAMSIAVALGFRGLFIFPVLLARVFSSSPVDLLRSSMLRPLVIATLSIIAGKVIGEIVDTDGKQLEIQTVITIWITPAIIWVVLTWHYIICAEHKLAFENALKKAVRVIKA